MLRPIVFFVTIGVISIITGRPLISTNNSTSIIEIPSTVERSYTDNSNKPSKPRYFYKIHQDPNRFEIASASFVFTKISRLTLAVHHAVPMVYNIRVQISTQLQNANSHSVIRFLIDDNVLIGSKLLPNNEKRAHGQPVWYKNMIDADFRGGSIYSSGVASWIVVPQSKSEWFIMPPGTHYIDVGARTDNPLMWVYAGELFVELTEYDANLHIGLDSLIIPKED